MKKKFLAFLIIPLCVFSLVGCGSKNADGKEDKKYNDLSSWVGSYTNSESGTTLYLSQSELGQLYVEFNGDSVASIYVDTESLEEFSYDEVEFDEHITLDVKRNGKTLTVSASSELEYSFFNQVTGEYVLNEFTKAGFDGVYKKDNITITLNELEENRLAFVVTGMAEGTFFYNSYDFDDYDSSLVNYEDTHFGDDEVIKITKTNDGIKIEASSTDEGSILNLISGEYKRSEFKES